MMAYEDLSVTKARVFGREDEPLVTEQFFGCVQFVHNGIKYRANNVVKTCDSTPSQWDIETDRGKLYARYRHDWFYLQPEEFVGTDDNFLFQAEKVLLDPGYMTTENMIALTSHLVDYQGAEITEK
jgi:hypothetical protein